MRQHEQEKEFEAQLQQMKESHAEAGKEEMGKIVYQKNKEIGDMFNQKNELQQEI